MINKVYVDLFLNGKIWINKDFSEIATSKLSDNFETHGEKIIRLFPGCTYNKEDLTIVPAEGTPTVKFSDYISLLKSKVDDCPETQKWIFEGHSYYLDGTEDVPMISYISFPRSGNTFFRKFFETITNITDGQYAKNEMIPILALQLTGLKGQGVADNRVWLVGTHTPEVYPPSLEFDANRGILCVRNPLDVIVSMLHLQVT